MSNDLVSVILPVFNGEATVERALRSLKRQSYQNIEVLIIDNASEDGTASICRKVIKELNLRAYYIYTEKKGVSRARNIGLDQCSGDYICFLDSDDAVHPDFVSTLIGIIKHANVDIAVVGMRAVSELAGFNFDSTKPAREELISIERLFLSTFVSSEIGGFVGNKMYSASAIADIRFDETLSMCEDQVFMFGVVSRGAKMAYYTQPMYAYYVDGNSASHCFARGFDENGISKYDVAAAKVKDLFAEREDLIRIVDARRYKNSVEAKKQLYWSSEELRGRCMPYIKHTLSECRGSFLSSDYYTKGFKIKYFFWELAAPVWSLKRFKKVMV